MSKNCDFYLDKGSKYICTVKQDEVNYSTYREYCKDNYSKKCPIYQYYLKEKDGKI